MKHGWDSRPTGRSAGIMAVERCGCCDAIPGNQRNGFRMQLIDLAEFDCPYSFAGEKLTNVSVHPSCLTELSSTCSIFDSRNRGGNSKDLRLRQPNFFVRPNRRLKTSGWQMDLVVGNGPSVWLAMEKELLSLKPADVTSSPPRSEVTDKL